MRRFIMYRRGDLSKTHNKNQVNKPDEPQFEGIVFDDGTCVLRWLTLTKSTSIWDTFKDMMVIHGHPEYDSKLIWLDAKNKKRKMKLQSKVSWTEFKKLVSKGKKGEQERGFLNTLNKVVEVEK